MGGSTALSTPFRLSVVHETRKSVSDSSFAPRGGAGRAPDACGHATVSVHSVLGTYKFSGNKQSLRQKQKTESVSRKVSVNQH